MNQIYDIFYYGDNCFFLEVNDDINVSEVRVYRSSQLGKCDLVICQIVDYVIQWGDDVLADDLKEAIGIQLRKLKMSAFS